MPKSYAQLIELECPACGRPFQASLWLVVDAQERPDLAAAVRDATIHDISCPSCGQAGAAPAPLLYHDQQARRVLFAVPPGMDEAQWREEAQGLLWLLIGALPEEQRRPYLGELQAEAGVQGLAAVLQTQAPSQAVDALGESLAIDEDEVPLLVEAVLALLDAPSPAEVQRVLDAYPFLLDPVMDLGLRDLAEAAREQEQPEVVAAFERAREILTQLRALLGSSEAGLATQDPGQPGAPDRPPATSQQPGARAARSALPAELPEDVPPEGWGQAMTALLDPEQELGVDELRQRYPALADPRAGFWLGLEVERRRAIGNLMEVQLLQEWRRQLEQ